MKDKRFRLIALLLLLATSGFFADAGSNEANAATLISAKSFAAHYVINPDGSFLVTEDILVDFGSEQRHGIFRYIPVEARYDAERKRVVGISGIRVDDGQAPVPFTANQQAGNLVIRIGDPDKFVTGEQRYRITYKVTGGLNAFSDHDELYWNVTGHQWEFPLEATTVTVEGPAGKLKDVACYQGILGSLDPCTALADPTRPTFAATKVLPRGQGMTVVVAIEKGAVAVAPPRLQPYVESALDQIQDFTGRGALVYGLTGLAALAGFGWLYRLWWRSGRDRWLGENYYLGLEAKPKEGIMPLFAHETIVPEFSPPELASRRRAGRMPLPRRQLRPAEVGLVLDERADTLDVSATIVDLAVRGYMKIIERPREGEDADYELAQLKEPDDGLLDYERELLEAIFANEPKDDQPASEMLSELSGTFWMVLGTVKEELYGLAVKEKLFPSHPENLRTRGFLMGFALLCLALAAGVGLGLALGVAMIALPVVAVAIVMLLTSSASSRRTGLGREIYRRSLGFRLFMTTTQVEYMRYLEEKGAFDRFLPYAIVFHCVQKWAKRFETLGLTPAVSSSWYVGSAAFAPASFALAVNDFSSGVPSAMAEIPAASSSGSGSGWAGGFSGSSGGGGGFSGGGGGGGGGGSW